MPLKTFARRSQPHSTGKRRPAVAREIILQSLIWSIMDLSRNGGINWKQWSLFAGHRNPADFRLVVWTAHRSAPPCSRGAIPTHLYVSPCRNAWTIIARCGLRLQCSDIPEFMIFAITISCISLPPHRLRTQAAEGAKLPGTRLEQPPGLHISTLSLLFCAFACCLSFGDLDLQSSLARRIIILTRRAWGLALQLPARKQQRYTRKQTTSCCGEP